MNITALAVYVYGKSCLYCQLNDIFVYLEI